MRELPLWVFYLLGFLSVLIADVSQILLKKAAGREYKSFLKSYLNFRVIFAYSLFALSTVFNMIALKPLGLSKSPVWQAMGQVFVVFLSYFVLNEKITKKKLVGVGIIITGIIISAL